MVGPSVELASKEQDKEQVREQDKEQVTMQDLIRFCFVPRSRKEMQEFMGWSVEETFQKNILSLCLRWKRLK